MRILHAPSIIVITGVLHIEIAHIYIYTNASACTQRHVHKFSVTYHVQNARS